MAVVAGGVARGADIADDLPLRDGLSLRNSDAGHVTVQRLVAVAVVDLHIVAVGIMPACSNDRAGVGGQNRRAVGSTDVRAAVTIAHPAADVLIIRHRPDEGAGADLGNHAILQLRAGDGDFRGRGHERH